MGEAACLPGQRNTSHFLPSALTLSVVLGHAATALLKPTGPDSETSLEVKGLEKPWARLIEILWELRYWLDAFYVFIVFGCQGCESWQEIFILGREVVINYWLHMNYRPVHSVQTLQLGGYDSHIYNEARLRSSWWGFVHVGVICHQQKQAYQTHCLILIELSGLCSQDSQTCCKQEPGFSPRTTWVVRRPVLKTAQLI